MIKTHYKSYSSYLPFALAIIYEENGDFNKMVLEACNKYKSLEQIKCDNIPTNVMAFVYKSDDENIIYLFATNTLTTEVLVHECAHIALRVFQSIGAEINEETDEFHAYILEMLFRDIYNILVKKFNFTPEMFVK